MEQFKSARSEGRESRLTVLLQGESGTGKSLTARAIAKELGAKCLIVQLGRVDRKSVPSVVSLFLARAKSMGCALVFEECEGLFNGNIFTGTDDGWAKLLFESYDGVAIFTTNYRLGYAMDRRMSMVIKFKAPDRKIRETIMLKEINAIKQAQGISKIPDEEAILGFARDTTTAGGFYRQILSLAVAQSPKGEITKAALTDAFEYAADVIQTSQDNGARESRISLKEVELPAAASRQVKHLIDYANKCISPLGVSPLLPQGATALFDGPPGSGKTITAEAIANELGIQMRRIGPSDLLSKWVGETEQQIRELFKDAEKKKYLLFIDEAEGLFASREGARSSWERTQANELLKQVESFKGVLIIATNLPELIDPAFGRRFLFQIHFPWPDAETRKRIWQKWTTELGVESSGLDELANKFEMSGGEIRNAAIRAIATGDTSVDGISAICRQISASRTGQVSKQIGI